VHVLVEIEVIDERKLTLRQKDAFLQLAIRCLPDITAEEVEEELCCEPIARVLAYR
jgi:hypothetical protein